MPSIINSDDGVISGSAGLKTTAASDGITVFQQNGAESMRIVAAGNVGIGTSSPATKLTVTGSGSSVQLYQDVSSIQFASTPNRTNSWYVGANISDAVNGGFVIGSGANISAGTARMTIDSSGNVGIGTSSPGSALDVKGTLRLSGSSSGYVGLAPAAAAGSTTYTLPAADGTSNQVLSTNGSGTLSWQTISASPTTAQVLSATAGASVGAVGTYAFLRETSNVNRAAGDTLAGSSLRYSSHQARPSFTMHAQASSGTPAGTWRLMGANSAVYGEGDAGMASVWLRIS